MAGAVRAVAPPLAVEALAVPVAARPSCQSRMRWRGTRPRSRRDATAATAGWSWPLVLRPRVAGGRPARGQTRPGDTDGHPLGRNQGLRSGIRDAVLVFELRREALERDGKP